MKQSAYVSAAPEASASVRPPRNRFLLITGGLLLGLGLIPPVALYLTTPRIANPVVWSTPIAPDQKTARYSMKLKDGGSYSFSAVVDDSVRDLPGDTNKTGCLLGQLEDTPTDGINCAQYGTPLSFTWRIIGPAGRLREGHLPTKEQTGTLDEEDRKRMIVNFATLQKLAPGDYTLEVEGFKLPPALTLMHPGFEVVLNNEHYDYSKDWTKLFVALGGVGLAIVGLVMLILGSIPGAISRR